jgi:UDPglucose--hexose-1-phosphate uridylyltransferase
LPETELRWHPLLEQWVAVAPDRQERTFLPPADLCPLCPTRPGGPETEIPEPDYQIAVFENRFPSFAGEHGRSEVVCYTAQHDSSLGAQPLAQIRDLIEVWRDRTQELARVPGVRYVFIFENRGEEIGVTLDHPHGQIYAFPFLPPVVERELQAFAGRERCLYCELLGRERGVVCEEPGFVAFVPSFARWPYEVQIAPRRHLGDLGELTPAEMDGFAAILKAVLQRYDALWSRPLAYVLAMHQRPPGTDARYHFHVELYPPNRTRDRLKYLAGSELGAGAFVVDARAEDTARELRELSP